MVSRRLQTILLLSVGLTIAGGLGLLIGGGRPRDPLHFLYAVVAFGIVPTTGSLTARMPARWVAVALLAAGVVSLVVIIRLWQTG